MTGTRTRRRSVAGLLPWLWLSACHGAPVRPPPPDLPLRFASDAVPLTFPAARFQCIDEAAWRVDDADGGAPYLELFAPSSYQPPHRSPLALALLREPEVGDFVLEVEAKQTGREYPHRDLVFVFGYRDPAHFGYAHLASAADANAHHVQLVDGRDRSPVTTQRSNGVAWGDGWHEVVMARQGTLLRVWFDPPPGAEAAAEPVLVAEVPDWRGCVGVGSFDDTGRFRRVRLFAAD